MSVNRWIMPEYFGNFVCKAAECRNTCCSGWLIPVSRTEYYRLITLDTSEELNRRIQNAFIVPEAVTESHYRLFGFNWIGYCHLLEDGLCSLHREKGESVLPEVCRLYPRSYKQVNEYRIASCSSACERVVEILFEGKESHIVERELNADARLKYDIPGEEIRVIYEIQMILQNESLPLSERIAEVCRKVNAEEFEGDAVSIADPLGTALEMLSRFPSVNPLLAEIIAHVKKRYEGFPEDYEEDRVRFEARFPDWMSFMARVINNSIIYSLFPFADTRTDQTDSYKGLCCMYGLFRLLVIGYMSSHERVEDLIDVTAAFFHLVEHTPFYHNVNVLAENAAIMLKL